MSESAYHHGRLREALVEAAVIAVREEGPEGLGIRSLARRLGVSHNAAYRHFTDRDDLIAEVAARVMAQLVAGMHARLDDVRTDDPVLRARRRLAACGRAYVDYAVSEPGLFRLAFNALSTAAIAEATPERDPLLLLGQVLDELVAVGFLAPDTRVGAELICWSAVHGFSVLCNDGPLRDADDAERRRALDSLIAAVDRSYGATTGTSTDPSDIT